MLLNFSKIYFEYCNTRSLRLLMNSSHDSIGKKNFIHTKNKKDLKKKNEVSYANTRFIRLSNKLKNWLKKYVVVMFIDLL